MAPSHSEGRNASSWQHSKDLGDQDKVQCVIEENNKYDKHVVALMKDETIVGHVPAEHSKIFKFFIRREAV